MLRKFLPAAVVLIGLSTGAAADGYTKQARYASYASGVNWSGCYLGGFLGGAWGGDVGATEAASLGGAFPAGTFYNAIGAAGKAPYGYDLDNSFIFGGTAGCNLQSPGSPLVLGVEGELGRLKLSETALDPNSAVGGRNDTFDSTKIGTWYGLIAGRLGVSFDAALIYVKGGVAFLNTESSVIDACIKAPCGLGLLTATGGGNDTTWAIGGGLEYALGSNWSMKGEYLFFAASDYSVCGPGAAGAAGSAFCSKHDVDGIHTVKLGINYKFGPK
jgi:outer membrane immunogenic protein